MNTAPHPKDVQEFLFKQASVSQICSNLSCMPLVPNLVDVDEKRGLLYIAHDNIITILTSGGKVDAEHKIKSSHPFFISKLSFNCDYSYLAITAFGFKVLIYPAKAFIDNSKDPKCLHEIQFSPSNAKTFVLDLLWNPSIPGMLCTVANDHTIGSFEIKDGKEKVVEIKALEKLNGIDALCLAWSPKGKQIVVGCKNGNIVQLKPDLKVARTITGPNPYIGEVISILWISNYQFCAAYLNDEKCINVLIIDAPKGETNGIFTCYEDITYGMFDIKGDYDIPRYYFHHIPEWGIIIAASSGSSEVAVLGSTDSGSTWNQWQLIDSGRAELPLIKTTESYPVGLAIDRTPTEKLAWGTDTTLPQPVPMLHILATSGQLCSFHMVNLTPNCPTINSAPTEIVKLSLSSVSSPNAVSSNVTISSAVTSTPLPKENQNTPLERPKTAVANIFGDSLKAAGFFQQSQQIVANTTEEKNSLPIKVDTKPDIPQKSIPQEVEKVDSKTIVAKEINTHKPVEPKIPIDDSIYIRAYTELHTLFEKELHNRLESQSSECGSEEGWKQLGGRSSIIDQFLRDLRETTNSLSTDIAYLKALLLQSFAWVEEAKSKNALNLESTTRNYENSKITELQNLFYYTQSQLTQANKVLDFEWSEHMYQKKSKMKIPSLEFLYQNLVLHNKIIIKEKNKIEQLIKKWKSLNRTNKISGLDQMMSTLKVSSKAASGFHGNTDVIDARCKTIASKTLSFTCQKQLKLKDLLAESSPKIIKPTSPSAIQDRLEATLSSLASLSPVNTDIKNKIEQPLPKYNTVAKQAAEALKSQCPLALLNNVVAKIGTSETNSVPIQNKAQQKQASNIVSFPLPPVNKFSQADKNSSLQQFSEGLEVMSQPLSKSDAANVDMTAQKAYSNIYTKPLPKDIEIKNDNQILSKSVFPKPESVSYSGSTLTNTLSLELSLLKSQSKAQNVPSSSVVTITPVSSTITKSEPPNTFSFSNQNMLPSIVKNSSSGITPATTNAETFSFVSNVLNTIPMPAPNQSPKELLDLMGLFLDLDKKDNNETPSSIENKNIKILKRSITTRVFHVDNVSSANSYTEPTFTDSTYSQSTTTPEKTFEVSPIASTAATLNTNDKTKAIFGANQIQVQPLSTSTLSTSTLSTSTLSTSTLNTSTLNTSTLNTPTLSTPTIFSGLPTTCSASIFGGNSVSMSTASNLAITKTTSSTTPVFGIQTTVSSPTRFDGFSNTPTISGFSSTTIASTTSPFYSSLSKPIFGQSSIGLTTANTTAANNTSSTTLTLSTTTTASSIAPAFGKAPQTTVTNSQFPTTTSVSSVASIFDKATITSTSMPFNSSSNTSVFGTMSTPSTASTASVFGGNSTNTVFGRSVPSTTNTSIFSGTSSTTFGTASTGSIFDCNATKPQGLIFGGGATSPSTSLFGGNAKAASSTTAVNSPPGSLFGGTASAMGNTSSGSIFGGSQSNISTSGSTSVFGTPVNGTSPIVGGGTPPVLGSQPAFGQPPAFGAKPVFGSPPGILESSKPLFGSISFGTTFGSTSPGGFGSPPSMGGSPSPLGNAMPTVFGNTAGSSTFESLASQPDGLTFGSLAQKSPEPEKPAFSGGSSFSNWR